MTRMYTEKAAVKLKYCSLFHFFQNIIYRIYFQIKHTFFKIKSVKKFVLDSYFIELTYPKKTRKG